MPAAGTRAHGPMLRGRVRFLVAALAVLVVGGGAAVAYSAFADTQTSRSPSGESMPVGNLDGWRQTFSEDFTSDVGEGSFPGPYSKNWLSYNGFADTDGAGLYDESIVSAHDGMLDLHVQTKDGTRRGAAPVPLVDQKWGGQKYGRFSVRMRSDEVDGYGAAFLLWSDRNVWDDGEIDFPEAPLGGDATAHNHCLGDPSQNCLDVDTGTSTTSWHTYTIEWKPNSLVYLLDGRQVASTTTNVPTRAMHWVMQVGSLGKDDPSASGHLLIDWATVYAYDPAIRATSGS
jgi:beta-glucanase (GH16 family)